MTKEEKMMFEEMLLAIKEMKEQKATRNTSSQKDSDFDEKKYKEISGRLGCRTQNDKAVWKSCRPLVKAIMDEEVINGIKVTEEIGKVFVELVKRSF